MEDEAEQVAEHENVVKTLANVQEDNLENFSFSVVDAMSEEEDGGDIVKSKSTKAHKMVSIQLNRVESSMLCCFHGC